MIAVAPKFRMAALALLACPVGVDLWGQARDATASAQSAGQVAAGEAEDRPLPEIAALMHDVEINQRKAEAVEKDYLYRSVSTEEEVDGSGQVKKTTVTESDHFWLDGVPVRRLMKKNGKELGPEEIAKEDDRIEKDAAKARARRQKADAEGKETDPNGEEEITVSRLLELGAFSNARRVEMNGRDTIAVDYAGDPKANTRNQAEEAVRDLSGTAWIDESDRMLVRVEGHFANAFKVGWGLIADVHEGTSFTMQQTKVNDEVWLPARIDAQGAARALLFFSFSGNVHIVDSDYRKFEATSTILPGVVPVEAPGDPGSATSTGPRP